MGYASHVLTGMDAAHPFYPALEQITSAAEKAGGVTRQLLNFSRLNAGTPKTIQLNDVLLAVDRMLKPILRDHIEVKVLPAAEPGLIYADPGLIEQVIVNLAMNARDAMPEGGQLFLETSMITVEDPFASECLSVPLGTYVSLGVTDTGTGMTPEVQARLFEPFFTTKEPGKGTGLGLSTVYGIVKQSGGSITVHSGPGLGTAFRILFPAVSGEGLAEDPARPEALAGGSETVLVLEDEPGVRAYVRDTLQANGYCVLEAASGEEALGIARHHKQTIHLFLTDIVLPGISGPQLIQEFRALRPGVPVLRMSGYPDRYGAQPVDGISHLQKPFSPRVLLTRVRKILDSRTLVAIAGLKRG